jgi:predicted GNAT superfamily acetyltransferase
MSEDNVSTRLAGPDDLEVVGQSGKLPMDVVLRKLRAREIILLSVNDQPTGYLWFSFLWSSLPFVDLIYINDSCRKRGLSRILLGCLEDHLKARGFDVLYSSSQLDEPAPQAWHRHMGFEECGVINGLNEGGIGEVFFRKAL